MDPNKEAKVAFSASAGAVLAFSVFLFVGLFGFFVWPTPYERFSDKHWQYRVNRVSGRREVLSPSGWRPYVQKAFDPNVINPNPWDD